MSPRLLEASPAGGKLVWDQDIRRSQAAATLLLIFATLSPLLLFLAPQLLATTSEGWLTTIANRIAKARQTIADVRAFARGATPNTLIVFANHFPYLHAPSRTRTYTPVRTRVFKTRASTNSAIGAKSGQSYDGT